MASAATYADDQSDTTLVVLRPTSHRSTSPSHSSNSSFGSSHSFQYDITSPLISPTTPLQFPSEGVPFSWEHTPGIPKQKFSRKNSSSLAQLLPLPPPAGNSSKKRDDFSPRKYANESFRKDPFFAAFVECSKEDILKGSSKVASIRSLSDRFGFINMYTSCKTTCAVSESIVYRPRSRNYARKY